VRLRRRHAAAKKEGRGLTDADVQAIPVTGLLHVILEIHARGLLNTGPATARFATGKGAMTKKMVLDFAYPPLSDKQAKSKGSIVLIDAAGKGYKAEFDFGKLRW
jgi:hypothetical protein